jgi:hypothetical protein
LKKGKRHFRFRFAENISKALEVIAAGKQMVEALRRWSKPRLSTRRGDNPDG